jgi:hypothetical protein
MKVDDRLSPILARSYEPNGDAVAVGVGVELRVRAKTADVSFVGEIDRDFGLVGDRMQ